MSEQTRQQRVLVVEDEMRLRKGLLRAIPAMGFVPLEAGSAEEAIKVMERDACEVILLDLRLPGMGGMDFFEIVRKRWPETQVIITTGFGNLDTAQKAIHLDAVEFLTKPCALHDLELADLMANVPGQLYLKDRNGVYIFANDAIIDGDIRGTDLIGKTDFDMPWKARADDIRREDLQVMESGETRSFREVLPQLDGSVVTLATIKAPLRNQEGQIIGIIGASQKSSSQER